MARPKNRYARAQARARYRKPRQRRAGAPWNLALASVVIVGVFLLVLSRQDGAGAGPRPGDHWHASLDVNGCGAWLPPAPEFHNDIENPNIQAGVHAHGDGLVHMHPYTSGESGGNADIGRFLGYNGFDLTERSFELWPDEAGNPVERKNGDPCTAADGSEQPGRIQWWVNGEKRSGNPADYAPEDQDRIVVAFAPMGTRLSSLGEPPNAANLPNPIDEVPDGAPAAGTSATTLPPDPTATTTPATPTLPPDPAATAPPAT